MHDMRMGVCPLCQHNEVIETIPLQADSDRTTPLSIAQDASSRAELELPGMLRAYICRKCGYTQWFTREPALVPIGQGHRSRLVKGREPTGNY